MSSPVKPLFGEVPLRVATKGRVVVGNAFATLSLEDAIDCALQRISQISDAEERRTLFNSEMDRLQIFDPVLKRELWVCLTLETPERSTEL